jgi:hypothetical protein
LKEDPRSKVARETAAKDCMVMVADEITTGPSWTQKRSREASRLRSDSMHVECLASVGSLPLTYKKGSMKPSPPLTGSASASPPSPPLTGLALASQPHSRLRHRRHPNRLTGLASAVPPSLPLTGSALVSKISKPRSSGFATQDFFIWLLYEYYYKIKVPALLLVTTSKYDGANRWQRRAWR